MPKENKRTKRQVRRVKKLTPKAQIADLQGQIATLTKTNEDLKAQQARELLEAKRDVTDLKNALQTAEFKLTNLQTLLKDTPTGRQWMTLSLVQAGLYIFTLLIFAFLK